MIRHDVPQATSRQALGRIARLGDLYDATTEKFCGVSIFREQLPPNSPAISKTDNPQSNISFTTVSTFCEKLQKLNVTSDLQLSVLAEMCQPSGAAKFLREKKESFKSVEHTLIYNIQTVTEYLELSHEQVKSCISEEAMQHPTATHVVIGIDWGANCAVTVTDQNKENKNKQEVGGNLKLQLDKLQALVKTAANVGADYTQDTTDNQENFSFQIFGDVIPEECPYSLDGAQALMDKIPQLIKNSNDGKGKPLTYVMLPLSSLPQNESQTHQTVRHIGKTWSQKVVRLFDRITELRQKVHDYFEEITNYSDCVTSNELEEARRIKDDLETQESQTEEKLAELLEKIRSAKEDVECLNAFYDDHYKAAKDLFDEFNQVYEAVQPRIEFIKRCENIGVIHLTPPSVNHYIDSNCCDFENVYVLFYGNILRETTTKDKSEFVELAKVIRRNSDSNSVCCIVWSDQNGYVGIKQYYNGSVVFKDVAKRMEKTANASATSLIRKCGTEIELRFPFEVEYSTDLVSSIASVFRPSVRVPLNIRCRGSFDGMCSGKIPFTVRCPGSFDGRCSGEKRSWSCMNCNDKLQLNLRNMKLYCYCRRESVCDFEFLCCNDAHGPDFKQFSDKALCTVIQDLQQRYNS